MMAARAFRRAPLLFIAGLLLSGCGREEMRAYTIPKEQPEVLARQMEGSGAAHIHWGELPSNWTAVEAGGMRAASFSIVGAGGQKIELSVVPLPGVADSDLSSVNHWRAKLELPPISSEELLQLARPVQVGSEQAQLFEISSEVPIADGNRVRMLAVILSQGETAWFFRMSGEDRAVEGEKGRFLAFLKTVEIHDGSHAEDPAEIAPVETVRAAGGARGDPGHPAWTVPGGWQPQQAPPMVLHSFLISGSEGSARLEISRFPGDVGGPFLNVNRWRRELSLDAIEESELPRVLRNIDVAAGRAMLVDLTGTDMRTGRPARTLVAMVPRAGETWFYKMIGDPSVVAAEQERFIEFLQTVRYPNG